MTITKKYRIRDWSNEIDEVECVRETAKSLVLRKPRTRWLGKPEDGYYEYTQRKVSKSYVYLDTWQEAKDSLIARSARKINNAEKILKALHEDMAEIKAMHQ